MQPAACWIICIYANLLHVLLNPFRTPDSVHVVSVSVSLSASGCRWQARGVALGHLGS